MIAPRNNATNAIITCRQYGRRYVNRRRIKRASYAFPRISSSWELTRHPACQECGGRASGSRRGQLLLEQLFPVQLGVESVLTDQLLVRSALDDAAALE